MIHPPEDPNPQQRYTGLSDASAPRKKMRAGIGRQLGNLFGVDYLSDLPLVPLLLVAAVVVVVAAVVRFVATGFFTAAGASLWEWIRKKIDPDAPDPPDPPRLYRFLGPPGPRERYFVTQHQFDRWTGEPLKVHAARRAEGYSFSLQIEERVPAFKSDGWEHMLVNDMEIWWTNPSKIACAFLMRK